MESNVQDKRSERILNRRLQKRQDKKYEEKDLIRLWKKYDRLHTADWSNRHKLVPLEKPIRSGYQRFFVLREDIAKSREAPFYNGLLKLVQVNVVSNRKDFTYKDWKTKKWLPIRQDLRDIPLDEWNKLGLTDKQKRFFEKVWMPNISPITGKEYGGRWVYVFNGKSWMFTLKRAPFYITHQVMVDSKLKSEMQELSNKIERDNLWPKIYKVRSRSYGYKEWKNVKETIELKAIMKHQMIDLMYMDDAIYENN